MTNAPHANINDNDYIHHKLSWFSHHLQNDIGNHTMIYMYIVNILINIALTRFPGWKWGLIFLFSELSFDIKQLRIPWYSKYM